MKQALCLLFAATCCSAQTCWRQLCTSCDFTHSSAHPEYRVATGQTLEQCKASCAASARCTAIDFGKLGRAGECYHNTGTAQTHRPSTHFDAYVPTPCAPTYGGGATSAGTTAGVSGDPFVTYMGKKTQVWLPLGKEVSLMQCDAATPWELRGTAFGSGVAGDSKQWFGSISLRAGEAEQVRVEAKETALAVTASPGFLNTTVAQNTVTVTAPGVGLEFTSASVNGKGHVDLRIKELKDSACRGALPEIWGLVPMSEATAAMLVPLKA